MTFQEKLQKLDRLSRHLAIGLVLLSLALLASPAQAQTYYFSVPELRMQVYMQEDASTLIVYDITFANNPNASPIDIVDIGMPTRNYNIGNMSASIGGSPLNDIRVSEFVSPGVEIHLDGQAIQPGATGTLHFEFTMTDLVFGDTTQEDFASFQITPTWYGSEYIYGTTRLQIAIHMLPGILPEEVLYQNEAMPFTTKAIFQERTVVAWDMEVQLTGPNEVGVSFPTRGMTGVKRMTNIDLALMWFENNTNAQVILGLICLGLFSVMFFRFTGGTGGMLWLMIAGIFFCVFVSVPTLMLAAVLPLIGLFALNEAHLKNKKKTYLPPIAQVEGGGIKRGLTAPEAAALLEMPINKVLTLIVFGLLKKGILAQVAAEPLTVEIAPEFKFADPVKAKDLAKARQQAAQNKGTVLHAYEQPFLAVIDKSPGKPLAKMDFSAPMKGFLENVAKRIKGFDLSDTQDYYKQIVSRAWKEAKDMGELPERDQFLDKNMEWVLMHENYPTVFAPRPYQPVWVRPIAFGPRPTMSSGGPSIPSSGGGKTNAPSFGDVAGGFAGWAENTMGGLAGSIMPGKITVPGSGGVVNLSGFDKATGDFFEALSKSSGSSSGGGGRSGGGCACACAGCACACACAGGGR